MDDLSGQEIRGYVLRERIGLGGFAAVYRAFQPAVERDVAIKIILPRYANDPAFVRRFESEAQLIARLEHIHIVPLFDYWREPNSAYLVMRWLRGGTLFDSIQQHGPWMLVDTARLMDQIAAALTVAHRQGVIHQDLTPANILLDPEKNAFLADFGIARDLIRDQETSGRQYGSPAYIAPERIKQEPATPQTDIYSLGIVLYELLTGRVPFDAPTRTTLISMHLYDPVPPLQIHSPDLPPSLNAIIIRATAKEPQARYASASSMAADFRQAVQAEQDIAFPRPASPSPADAAAMTGPQTIDLQPQTLILAQALAPQNPYKGLRAFDEADASDFFGRGAFIEQLLTRLSNSEQNHHFLAVVGPSGSGKSSVVRAGLLPALRRGALPGSDFWFVAKMVPGAFPFEELETALLSVTFDESTGLIDRLRTNERGLFEIVHQILPDDDTDLVLVIDQFEELFTLVDDEAERARFLKSLHTAVTEPGSRLWLIITLRADFYDRPLLYPEFGQLIRERTEVVLPLSTSELHEAIAGPAEHVKLTLEADLVAAVLADVLAQPGALPLLQYALTELFERRTDHTLTLDAYRASGGVLGALARRAEELYTNILPSHRDAIRQLFLRLISLGEGTEDTRRRVRWAELVSIGQTNGQTNKKAMETVLNTFGQYRLLTFDRDPQTREPTVEVAHEALIRQWGRLREWLDENRAALRIQRRLTAATEEWINADRHRSYLATGARLTQFETLAGSAALAPTADEMAYLHASTALRERAARRLRLFIAALVVLTVVALGLAAFAFDRQNRAEDARDEAEFARGVAVTERDRADEQAQIARSRELAATALSNLDQLDLALLLSLEAVEVYDTVEARNSLLTGLQSAPYLSTFLHGQVAPVRAVAFSPDGRLLAAGGRDGTITLWDVATRQPIDPAIEITGPVNSLVFSPDGQTLAGGADDGTVRLWDVETGAPIGQPWEAHMDSVWSVAFSPDGNTLASGSVDTTIRLWDVEKGIPVGDPLEGHTDYVYSVAFSPDGDLLASGSADGTIRIWNVETSEPVGEPLEGHTNWVWSVAFSPDEQLLASGSADNTIRMWDVATGEPVGEPLTGHTGWVRSVAFISDGTLVSGSADGTIRLWDVETGRLVMPPLAQHIDAVWGVTVHPDGHTVASAGADARVLLWNTQVASLLRRDLTAHQDAVLSVAFRPDGKIVASASGSPAAGGQDNTIRLVDAATGDVLHVLAGHHDSVSSVAFSPDGTVLVSGSYDGTVIFWDVESGEMIHGPLFGHDGYVNCVAFSPGGQIVASGSNDGRIVLWDAASGELAGQPFTGPFEETLSLAFSPDGGILVSGHYNGTIIVWNTTTGQPVGDPLTPHTEPVTSVRFNPDGAMLASGSRDDTIILWNTTAWTPLRPPLTGHTNWVLSVAFDPGGRWLASGSRDESVILWDIATGRPVGQPLTGHQDWVTSVAFSPDGQMLASGSWDNTTLVWAVGLDSWQEQAHHLANRSLNAAELERYLGE